MYYHDLFQLVVDLTSDSTDSSRSSRSSTPSTINLSSDPEDLFDDDDEDYANYEANDDVVFLDDDAVMNRIRQAMLEIIEDVLDEVIKKAQTEADKATRGLTDDDVKLVEEDNWEG